MCPDSDLEAEISSREAEDETPQRRKEVQPLRLLGVSTGSGAVWP